MTHHPWNVERGHPCQPIPYTVSGANRDNVNVTWRHLADAHDAINDAIMSGMTNRSMSERFYRERLVVAEYARHLIEEVIASDHRSFDDQDVNAALDYERRLWADRQETLI